MDIKSVSIDRIPNVAAAVSALRSQKAQVYPVRSTYASKIGHPCMRFLTYHRTAWDLIPKPDAKKMGVFRRGTVIGEDIATEVREALKAFGIQVVEQEVAIPPNEYDIGGRIDFGVMIAPAEQARPIFVPVEAKSMNEFTFADIPQNDAEALDWMLHHKAHYIRCYPIQIMTYMHFRKIDVGLIYVRNASSYEDRQILVRYNPETMAAVLEKAAELKDLVEEVSSIRGNLPVDAFLEKAEPLFPARIPFDPDICGRCDFCAWCVPDIKAAAGVVDRLNDQALEANCRIMLESAEMKAAYDDANTAVGDHCKAVMADLPAGGPKKTILTMSYAIVVSKGKTVTKKVMAIADLTKGTVE
jgi:hypothetical protein